MDSINIKMSDLGIIDLIKIKIELIGKVEVYASEYFTVDDIEIKDFVEILFEQDEMFISMLDHELNKYILNNINTKYYICHRQKFNDCYLIYVFGMLDLEQINLYLNSKKDLLYKLSLFINKIGVEVSNFKVRTYNIGTESWLCKDIPSYKIHHLWAALQIDRYPIRHKLTHELVILSKQQSKVMLGLAKNQTLNEIYTIYNIKPKTSEFYMQLIKAKTGYSKKIELICAFLDTNPWLKVKEDRL